MKYALLTFGCRVNQADSLAIEAELAAQGAEAVSSERAELVIVNTCSVTASADQGARQTIRRIARENPTARIVATGCYATRCPDEVAALPGVAAIVRNDDKAPADFFRQLAATPGTSDALSTLGTSGTLGTPGTPGTLGTPGTFHSRTAWTLRVQTGCDETCSYCIIPTTRGAGRSRTWEDVHHELARVLDAGYKEIVVTGVHLGSYGRDLSPPASLHVLLARLVDAAESTGRGRVLFRVSSLEPMDFPLGMLDLPIAPHFHLPLQHASDRLLALMRRPYTLDEYRRLVDAIRARLPHAAIGADVIVGFPEETDEDFATLVDYLEESPLTYLHVFPYSDRPGTEASALPRRVHGSVIRARARRLREISRLLSERFREGLRGCTRPALTIEDGSVAVTDNYVRVPISGGHARNEWITATL